MYCQNNIIFSWLANNHAPSQPKTSDLKTQVQQVRFNKSIPPLSAQEPTPMELFLYHSQAATFARGPGKMNERIMTHQTCLFISNTVYGNVTFERSLQ